MCEVFPQSQSLTANHQALLFIYLFSPKNGRPLDGHLAKSLLGVCHLPKGFFFPKNGRGLGFSDTKGR